MIHKPSRVVRFLFILTIFATPVWAVPVDLHFTNADVNLGGSSVIVLAGIEYLGFGISVSETYRYIDGRDPFSDAPDDVGVPCPNANTDGRCNFGLSNNDNESPGRIDFLTPQSNVSFDWWVLGGFDPQYIALDINGVELLNFSPAIGDSGTENIAGEVASILWFNGSGGFSSVSNLRFGEEDGRIPEPGSLLLLGVGVVALGVRSRWRS